jgi:hypothetical protein
MAATRHRHLPAVIRSDPSYSNREGKMMKRVTVFASVFFALTVLPLSAQAQGVPGGAAHGFNEGNRIAGPVGAVVGTAVGGVIGGVEGVLGVGHQPAAYSEYDAPPPPAYRPRHGRKMHHVRRGRHHRPAAGYVAR